MKKTPVLLLVILFLFTACKKDKDEVNKLDFSVKNLATLIDKSPNYIKQASPGTFNESSSDEDFLMFVYNEDSQLGLSGIGFSFEASKCNFITMLTPGGFDRMQYLMQLTATELGSTTDYELEYYINIDLNQETFTSYDGLWDFITDNDIAEEDIEFIGAIHEYNDLLVGAVGFYDGSFMPTISIMKASDLKSTASLNEKFKEFGQHIKLK